MMTVHKSDKDTAPQVFGWSAKASRFLWALPAWLLASAMIRVGELLGAGPLDGHLALVAAGFDVVDFLRWLPLLFLSAWPFLRLSRPWPLALVWSGLLLMQMGLSTYFLVARTPLGSDLFAYSIQELITTVRGADISVRAGPIFLALLAWAVLWLGLRMAWRTKNGTSKGTLLALIGISLAAWFIPLQGRVLQGLDLDAQLRAQNKTGFFLKSLVQMWQPSPTLSTVSAAVNDAAEPTASSTKSTDPEYPFARIDRSPDVLSAHFLPARRAPSLVFVVVEGLGRDFSGPNARLGSFTPFLDKLASQSLYFENFIAPQGRTFGVLPSLFGSLPFAERGFADLGEKMPAHDDLFSVLQANGYDARFYNGTNLDFDNERLYLTRQGVSKLRDLVHYQRSHTLPSNSTSWGFPDGDLVRFILADEAKEANAPAIVGLQTITMHTDYHFPGQENYRARVMQRLRELGIPESRWQAYRDNIDIFSAVLYTDDALRQLFEGFQALPGHADTVYILTGDHRLPELPMSDVMERHHVPLLINSPLLKAPASIRAVSSQFDLAPSLLAWLSHSYGLRTPVNAAWLGKGLDMNAEYQNLRDIPIKPVKGETPGMLSGDWYLLRGQLYRVSSQLAAEAASDVQEQARLQQKLDAFNAASQSMVSSGRLMPSGANGQLLAWDGAARDTGSTIRVNANLPAQLMVRDVHRRGEKVQATFVNVGGRPSTLFAPLLVVTDATGRELTEASEKPLQLAAGETRVLQLNLPANMLGHDRYLAVMPADPNSGKRVGDGVFHIPLEPE